MKGAQASASLVLIMILSLTCAVESLKQANKQSIRHNVGHQGTGKAEHAPKNPALGQTQKRGVYHNQNCPAGSFNYAGIQASISSHGISAVIKYLRNPIVPSGHAAGWVGVGSATVHIQIGYASFPPQQGQPPDNQIYYEIQIYGLQPKYYQVTAPRIQVGDTHTFAVLEVAGKPGVWRAWMDNKPVSKPAFLKTLHNGVYGQAVVENWSNSAGCNVMSYGFSKLAIAPNPSSGVGVWNKLSVSSGDIIDGSGYYTRIAASGNAFVGGSISNSVS